MVVFHPVSVAELGDAVPQTPWDLPLWSLKRQGHAGLGMPSPTCRLQASSRRSGCIPAEPYLPLKHPSNKGPCEPWQWRRKKPLLFSSFDRTAPSSFDRTTTDQSGGYCLPFIAKALTGLFRSGGKGSDRRFAGRHDRREDMFVDDGKGETAEQKGNRVIA